MWMQPAPADHLGPMGVGLGKPATDGSALPGCIPRLVRFWLVGSGSTWPRRTPGLWQKRPGPASEKSGAPGNRRRALAGRAGAASDKPARLMPDSPPPLTPPSSRKSRLRMPRFRSNALPECRHAGRETSHPLSLGRPRDTRKIQLAQSRKDAKEEKRKTGEGRCGMRPACPVAAASF